MNGVLTNTWVTQVWNNYSIVITAVPIILTALVKLLAIFDPKIPSDHMIEWIQQTFYIKKDKTILIQGHKPDEILSQLNIIQKEVNIIMGDTSKLTAALTQFSTDFTTLTADISAAVTALQNAVANSDQAAIDAATSQLTALDQQAQEMDANLKTALNPPTT